jgi:peptidoglycan DL-endopeptidase CwlO
MQGVNVPRFTRHKPPGDLLAWCALRAARPTRAARILVAFLAVLTAGVTPAVGGADRASELRSHASSLRADTAALEQESRSALLELYALETELASARARADSLAAETAAVRVELAQVRTRLRTARRAFAAAERGAARRVRALYEEGAIDPLDVILGSSSFDEALTRLDHVNRLANLDKKIAAVAQHAREHLVRVGRRLRAREARLVALHAQAEAATSALAQAHAERETYLGRLAEQQRLNESQIASLEDQAAAAEEQAREATADSSAIATTSSASTASAAPAPADVSGRQMTVLSTAYALTGSTATGIPVGPGIVAVDPAVIPLGTRMTIPGYGEGVAADTGGAIKGARIDVWVPTEAAAAAWGMRTVTITLH